MYEKYQKVKFLHVTQTVDKLQYWTERQLIDIFAICS